MVQDRYIQRRKVRLAALFLAALLLAAFGIGTVSALTWHTETVDSAGDVGTYVSLALDSAGNPRISYYDEMNQDLKYAVYDGSAWTIRTVDSAGSVGRFNSLALDSAGNPRISYYEWQNPAWESTRHLKYAAWNGSAWQIETVDSADGVGEYTSLALDAAGNPRISYWDAVNGDLRYAAWNGSAWQIQTLDAEGWVGMYSSLALDSAGNPRIGYYDSTNSDLKFAAHDGSAWTIRTVDSAGSVGRYASLALDGAGNPRISYYDDTNNGLKFAAYDGSAWTFQAADQAKYAGLCTSLALDSAGNPCISYIDVSTNLLKYAAWNGSAWHTETVDTGGIVGQFTSLALDNDGNPCISYYDYNNAELKYARGESPAAPAIAIEAFVSVDGGSSWSTANSPPGPPAAVGAPVQWRYTVLNTGNVDLTNVTVTDDRGVTVTAPKSTLAAGESMNATASGTAVEGQYANNGTAAGTYDGTQHVSATDPCHYLGIALPVAAFSANTTSGVAPLAVRFTNSSTGVIDSRSWDFGDGTTSTEADPTHTFATAGNYTVNLTVGNPAGSNSTSTTVQVSAPRPQANFTWTPEDPVAGEPVQFTDTSGGSPQWWGWTFGDGTAGSIERNPVHTYLSPGNYTVMLSAYYPGSEIGRDVTRSITVSPAVFALPPSTVLPTDTNGDGLYDDLNGNGRKDFGDVVLYFNQITWIAANEPISAFDYNKNGQIDFADVVWLFNNL